MSGLSTQLPDRRKESAKRYFNASSSAETNSGANLSRLQTVTLEIFRHHHRFRILKRLLSWIIGMILFTSATVLIYEHWF